jgi:hypothetical protein
MTDDPREVRRLRARATVRRDADAQGDPGVRGALADAGLLDRP